MGEWDRFHPASVCWAQEVYHVLYQCLRHSPYQKQAIWVHSGDFNWQLASTVVIVARYRSMQMLLYSQSVQRPGEAGPSNREAQLKAECDTSYSRLWTFAASLQEMSSSVADDAAQAGRNSSQMICIQEYEAPCLRYAIYADGHQYAAPTNRRCQRGESYGYKGMWCDCVGDWPDMDSKSGRGRLRMLTWSGPPVDALSPKPVCAVDELPACNRARDTHCLYSQTAVTVTSLGMLQRNSCMHSHRMAFLSMHALD